MSKKTRTLLIILFLCSLGSHPLEASKPSAKELFLEKNYQGALDLYLERIKKASKRAKSRLEFGAGTAALKAGNHTLAREHLGKSILTKDESLKAKAYYNLGNTLYAQGEAALKKAAGAKPSAKSGNVLEEVEKLWEGAIRQFEKAEKFAGPPLRDDAVFNRKLVRKKLDFLKNQQNQDQQNDDQQQDNQQQDNQQQDNQQQNEEQQSEDQQDSGGDDSKSEDGEKGSSEEKEKDGENQKENQQNQDPQSDADKNNKEGKEESDPKNDSQSQDDQEGNNDQGDQKNLDQPKQDFEGDIESGNQPTDSGSAPREAPDAFEATEDGKLSEAGARALLESLENEEVQLQIKPRKRQGGRIRDW
ncbi:MAG: hypothetical protein AAF514_15095 [Verrucomicrobiota bacterium]